jgi:hypothetical protein
VTRHFQTIGDFLFSPAIFAQRNRSSASRIELLGIGAVHGATVLVKVDCFIPKHCNA